MINLTANNGSNALNPDNISISVSITDYIYNYKPIAICPTTATNKKGWQGAFFEVEAFVFD